MAKINEVGILVKLSLSVWQARVTDRKAGEEVASTNSTDRSRLKVSKFLIDPSALSNIKASANALREIHEKYTLPWEGDGIRLLPVHHFHKYVEEMDKEASNFNHQVNEFCTRYNQLVQQNQENLGDLYRREEYPPSWRIRNKFGVKREKMPVPAGSHISQMNMDEAILGSIRKDIEKETEEKLNQAVKRPYHDINDAISRLLEKLQDPKEGEKDPIFRDSTFTTIKELISVLPGLNITNDPTLNEITEKLSETFDSVTANNLRPRSKEYDESARSRVTEALSKMQADYGDYFQVTTEEQ